MIYLTGDTHFNHFAITRHCGRPFKTIEEMNGTLIEEINSTVGKNDTLFHLGDFGWKASDYGKLRMRINVRELHVVKGNHDAPSLRNHVSSLELMVFATFNGQPYHMCHYPFSSWSAQHHGCICLHAHSHGRAPAMPRRFDVGVDVAYRIFGHYRPFSLSEVLDLIDFDSDTSEEDREIAEHSRKISKKSQDDSLTGYNLPSILKHCGEHDTENKESYQWNEKHTGT